MENMKKFGEILKKDQRLQEQLSTAKNHAEFITMYVKLAKEKGIIITESEVKTKLQSSNKKSELSIEELEDIAGGGATPATQGWCCS